MLSLFLSDFFDILNLKYQYAVLRNYDELPNDFKSKDIDILIGRKDFEKLKKDLLSLMDKYAFQTFLVNENERFIQVMIMNIDKGKTTFLHLDFFFNYSLYGIELMNGSQIIDRRLFNGSVYHVTLIDEFIDKFFSTSLLNHPYPKKYNDILQEVKENHMEEVNIVFKKIFNDENIGIDECQKFSGKSLLLKVLLWNLQHKPIKQIKMSLKFIYFYIYGWIKPNGFSISLTGTNQSQTTEILYQLEKVYVGIHREVKVYHTSPKVISKINTFNNQNKNFISEYRLVYYILDYIIGYYKVIKPVLFRRGIVLFNRYYADIISESKSYKILFIIRKLIPKINYSFILLEEYSVDQSKMKEIRKKNITTVYEKLNYILTYDKTYIRVMNSDTLALDSMLNYILKKQDQKYKNFYQ